MTKKEKQEIEKRANQKKELAILNAKQVEFNKLVNTVNSYKGQFKRQQKEIERLEARKYMFNAETGEISQIPIDNNYISKDKIKAKIEEYKEKCKNCNFRGKICKEFKQNYNCTIAMCLKEFYSLLEKE